MTRRISRPKGSFSETPKSVNHRIGIKLLSACLNYRIQRLCSRRESDFFKY